MGKHWLPTKNSKYYMPKEDFLSALHYALRYPYLMEELTNTCLDTSKGIRYDEEKVQTSISGSLTEEIAIKRAQISEKLDKITMALEAAEDNDTLRVYLKWGVCYGLTFSQLQTKGIPCGKDLYYEHRRRFYFELSKLI